MCLFNPVVDGGRFKKTVACLPVRADMVEYRSPYGNLILKGVADMNTFHVFGSACSIAGFILMILIDILSKKKKK